jgi:hypothetical protein
VDVFGQEGLDVGRLVVAGVPAVLLENGLGDVVGQGPPVDDEDPDAAGVGDARRGRVEGGRVAAVPVEDYYVTEAV